MEKQVNETFIKFSSKVPFPYPLELGDDLTVTVKDRIYIFNAVKSEDNDNQDGSVNRTFTLKASIE